MSLQITILGSGTIIPTTDRRSTSLVIARDDELFLFDCGPGTLDALEEAGLTFRDLKRVFLTHYHPDHTLGIGHLLAALRLDGVMGGGGSLTIFGPRGLGDFIERWHSLYTSTVLEDASLELVEVGDGDVYTGSGVEVRAAAVDHDGHAALAYRFEGEGRSVVYTGDTECTEALVELSRDVDLLFAECSFPDDRPMTGHMTPSAVGKLAARSGAGRVVLVHLYPVFGDRDPAAVVRGAFSGRVTVADDGMKIDL
jgi:ribonuclease BN (tRNA processing enzyme)